MVSKLKPLERVTWLRNHSPYAHAFLSLTTVVVFAYVKYIAAFAPICLLRNTILGGYRRSSLSTICEAFSRHLRQSHSLTGNGFTTSIWYARLKLLVAANINLLTHCGRVTHICVSISASVHSSSLAQITACRPIGTNSGILLIVPLGTNFGEILMGCYTFSFRKGIWKCCLENGGHFVSAPMCLSR